MVKKHKKGGKRHHKKDKICHRCIDNVQKDLDRQNCHQHGKYDPENEPVRWARHDYSFNQYFRDQYLGNITGPPFYYPNDPSLFNEQTRATRIPFYYNNVFFTVPSADYTPVTQNVPFFPPPYGEQTLPVTPQLPPSPAQEESDQQDIEIENDIKIKLEDNRKYEVNKNTNSVILYAILLLVLIMIVVQLTRRP